MRLFFQILVVILLLTGKSVLGLNPSQDSTVNKHPDFQFGVNAGFANKYMWRGMCYNQGLVFQPEASVSYRNLSFTVWSNIPIWETDAANTSGNETDLTLGYSNSVFNFDIESSLNYYHYFYDVDANTAEFLVRLSYPLGDFSLFTGFYIDLLHTPGAIYDELGAEYEKELSDKWTISGSLFTGMANSRFNSYYLSDENHSEFSKNAFNFLSANATLTYSPLKDLFIDAHFQFNHTIDKELTRSLLKANSNFFEVVFRKEF